MPPEGQFGPGKGLDPSWIAVDQYTVSHLHPPSRPNSTALTRTLEYSDEQGLHPMYSSRSFGKFLALQCRFGNVKHALDVGTLGGYSAIWMATQNPELRVTTIEYDAHHAAVARKNIEDAGVADRVDLRVGLAVDILADLLKDIEEGRAERVGFTFVDADKLNNWTYCDFAIRMGYPGACIIIDNVVQRGNLVREECRSDPHIQGARKAIEEAGKDDRIEATVIQVVDERSSDGFLMAVVN